MGETGFGALAVGTVVVAMVVAGFVLGLAGIIELLTGPVESDASCSVVPKV